MTIAIIVCSKVQEDGPSIYPFAVNVLYWPLENPEESQGSEEEILTRFRMIRNQIDQKIKEWLSQNQEG